MTPVDRPIASSRGERKPRVHRPFRPGAPPKHPSSGGTSRVTAARLEALRTGLDDEGRAVLLFLSQVRLATGFQLARRLWAAPVVTHPRARAARRVLARLEQAQLVDRLGRRMGGVRGGSTSIVYGLGAAGQRLLDPGRRARSLGQPGARYVAHVLDQTELIVQLHEASRDGSLELLRVESEPNCWRAFPAPFGGELALKPDLFVGIAAGDQDEDRWFIEVDRATESVVTVRAKAERYLAHVASGLEQQRRGTYPRVAWTVPDERRRHQLAVSFARLPDPAPRLFVVWMFEETVGRLAAEARR